MTLPILWSNEAKETFDIIINYLENNWGMPIASRFISVTNQKINLISKDPYLFKSSISQNVRQTIITKHNSMFYEVHEDRIMILFFMDNRQEPII